MLQNVYHVDHLYLFNLKLWSLVTRFRLSSHGSSVYQLVLLLFPFKHISFSLQNKHTISSLANSTDALTCLCSCLVSVS